MEVRLVGSVSGRKQHPQREGPAHQGCHPLAPSGREGAAPVGKREVPHVIGRNSKEFQYLLELFLVVDIRTKAYVGESFRAVSLSKPFRRSRSLEINAPRIRLRTAHPFVGRFTDLNP